MTTTSPAAIKTRSRNHRKAIAIADATLLLSRKPLPHDMPALIAELLANPDAGFVELHLLENLARENAWAKAAAGRRDWLAGMDHYAAATRDALDGGDVRVALQKLTKAIS